MLLELIPPSPTLPSFRLFIDFADFTHGHPNPLAWSSQLSTLLQHELDLPRSMHMLDRAVGLTTLLESVRFDLRNSRSGDNEGPGLTHVRCEFVDGGVVEWTVPLSVNGSNPGDSQLPPFLKVLHGILKDIQSMRLEEERSKLALQYEQQAHQRNGSVSHSTSSSTVGPSLARRFTVSVMRQSNSMSAISSEASTSKSHKRQKSFLQSIRNAVGSIVSRDSASSSNARTVTPTPAPSGPVNPLSLHSFSSMDDLAKLGAFSSPVHSHRSHLPHNWLDQQDESTLTSAAVHHARAQYYRERVRAALVDAYRRFVLAGLAVGGSSSAAFLTSSAIEEVEAADDDDTSTVYSSSSEESSDTEVEMDVEEPVEEGTSTGPVTSTPPRSGRRRRPPTPSVSGTQGRSRANSAATTSTNSSSKDPYAPGKREAYSYYTWVLKSMLRRTEEEMEVILKRCEEERRRELDAELLEKESLEREQERRAQAAADDHDEGRREKTHSAKSQGTPSLKKSPSKLLKRRSEGNLKHLVTSGSSTSSRFSLGNFMLGAKRKSKQQGSRSEPSSPSSPSPRLSPVSPVSPVQPATPMSSPSSPRRLVHFALVADSDVMMGHQDDIHDDSGRFSPTTMDVPSSFSDDSDPDEGEDHGELDEVDSAISTGDGLSSGERSGSRTSTSTATTSISGDSETTETETSGTVETCVTTPSSSPPLSCGESDSAHTDVSAEDHEIQYGYAVTCDEAVTVNEHSDILGAVPLVAPSTETLKAPEPEPECFVDQEQYADIPEPICASTSNSPSSSSSFPTTPESPVFRPSSSDSPPPKPTKPFILPPSYTNLLDLTHKLRSLLIHATLSTQAIKEEEQRIMEMLEVRGRRRAWSCGAFLRGVPSRANPASGELSREGMLQEIMAGAKGRADQKKREWEIRVRKEEKRKRRERKGMKVDDEQASVSWNDRALPPLPLVALSTPFQSSPLALVMYTAEEKEEKEGLVYECPVKEQTVFYLFLNPGVPALGDRTEGVIIGGPADSLKRGKLSLEAMGVNMLSAREQRIRRSQGYQGYEEGEDGNGGFVDCGGNLVDEDGFVYRAEDITAGRGGSDDFLFDEDDGDDGIEWQTNSQGHYPPLSPTSMGDLIPPRPRSMPTRNHPPPARLLPVSEEDIDEDDLEERFKDAEDDASYLGLSPRSPGAGSLYSGHSPLRSASGTTTSSSTITESEDEDEFVFDTMRSSMANRNQDDDDEFFADITHITHIVDDIEDGLGRRAQAEVVHGQRRFKFKLGQPGGEESVHHRQRAKANKGFSAGEVGFGSEKDSEEEATGSLTTMDGGFGSKSVSDFPSDDTPRTKKPRNHRRQWQALALDTFVETPIYSSPISPINEEDEEEQEVGLGMRISLEAERPMPTAASGLKLQPTSGNATNMFKRLSPVAVNTFSNNNALPPSPALSSRDLPTSTSSPADSYDDVIDIGQHPYVPYGRIDIVPAGSLSQDSLLCQPIRFAQLPAGVSPEPSLQPLKPQSVKLVMKQVAAAPPPSAPSSLVTPSAPRLRISVKSRECERIISPDVPRSPSPTSPPASTSSSPSPPPPLSPTPSSDGSVTSPSSTGPNTPSSSTTSLRAQSFGHLQNSKPIAHDQVIDCTREGMEIDGVWEAVPALMNVSPPIVGLPFDDNLHTIGVDADGGSGEEFTLSMDVRRERKRHLHGHGIIKQKLARLDQERPLAKAFSATPIPPKPSAHPPAPTAGAVLLPNPASVVRGTTTTKSAMRRKGIDLAFFDPPSTSTGR
ncbi:hypothetical protein CC1G_09837 [Coprinopsis cinerea okayama7|uniref:Uncharacterized protein n=1 Tax=Coprinopsis cinerea (strain Okayama-7 / 130 / ATCC MYA-4618 / FGSC 9003) TaxID=240176 RepID=A8P0C0_COPC7|nr:hypothetical protein CC1G_09837 [Coprinopsis cinerea okayama7\|eukprot:XP_001837855.2 hypothetical protein CC1G_09837 [Coprinopsis cinerea okayama7\